MARADEFRDQAAACLEDARRAAELESKLELLAIAKAWLDLADLSERAVGMTEHSAGQSASRRAHGGYAQLGRWMP